MAVLDLAVALEPTDIDTRYHRALLQLLMGNLAEGFAGYEARFETKLWRGDKRHFRQPEWRGEELAGRTILLYAEQGLGDTLQFCRYAALVAARGGRVVLEAPPPLRHLLDGLAGVERLIAHGEEPGDFDVQCPLLALPHLLGTDLESIPAAIPYLATPDDVRRAWRDRLGRRVRTRVGLVWAGNPRFINDRRRSLPFAALAPLWSLPSIDWFSLQVGPRAEDLASAPSGLITDLAPELHDFAETAAAVEQMDLVISVDTAVAHLAGALSKPVLLLLPFAPDWRWMRRGETSPWYPGHRLLRQDMRREWANVIDAAVTALG